jgi:hypothetical protein
VKKKMRFYGSLIVTLHDGRAIKVAVKKAGRAVELRFLHPVSGLPVSMLVHPLNEGTVQGWMHEIGVQCDPSISVAKWQWEDR